MNPGWFCLVHQREGQAPLQWAMRRYFASPWVEAQRRHLAAAAAGPTPRALDLGCGKGRHAMLLMDMGFEVTAVDCDGASLAQLRQREDKVKIVQMDLEEEGTSLMSLGHFDVMLVVNFACRSLLPKLPKLLKDDGIFIFESWAQGNESYATPKDGKALQGLLRPNELLEATALDFTVLAYAHGLQEDYEGRDCVKQMICCKKNPQPGPQGHVVPVVPCPVARLLSGDAAFLEDAAFGKNWVHSVGAALELDFGIEELLNLLVGYDPVTARKEYLGLAFAQPMVWLCLLLTFLYTDVASAAGRCEASDSKAANLLQKAAVPAVPVDLKQVMWLSGVSLASTCMSREAYLEQYEIALLSWKETNNSAFDPHLLVHLPNGTESLPKSIQMRLDRFKQMGVHVVFHSLSFMDALKKNLHNMRPTDDLDADCVAASFLRLELPKTISQRKLLRPHYNQDYVLWTDCDIMWWRKVSMSEFLSNVPTHKFSLAFSGQSLKEQSPVNTGVVLMDLKNYQQDMPKLLASITTTDKPGLDQALVYRFYEEHPGLSGWSVIWNYRMFWNGHEPVAILHYWGLKPSAGLDCWMHRRSLVGCPPIEKGLIPEDRRLQFQKQALDMAMREDHKLIFMREAARMGSSVSRPALWDVVLVRRSEGRTETMKPEEVKEFLSKADLKTKADLLKRGEGWTLVVSQLQGAPALAELHRRLFAATGLGGGINAYLTPPGSVGKPPHIDDHDVVVLQFSGSKCWTLLDDSRSNPRAEVTLVPKDVMYLPQGIPHHAAALAVDDPSLHLAVALHRRPMALSSVLAALLTLRSLDPGEGAMLQASVVEEMEGRSQSFAAFGAREHWLNQLLPMHLPLVHALAPEDVERGILEAFCDLLHRRALDLAELVRTQDCSDADVGLPPGTARQRALLRASAAGSEMELEEAAKLPKQANGLKSLRFQRLHSYTALLFATHLRLAMPFTVALLSGRSVLVEASTASELLRAAQKQLQLRIHRLIAQDGQFVGPQHFEGNHHVVHATVQSARLRSSLSSTSFALLQGDGSVMCWGDPAAVDNRAVQDQLKDIVDIAMTSSAFAAVRADGSCIMWGNAPTGVVSGRQEQLVNVRRIVASRVAFAALREDGRVVSWGGLEGVGHQQVQDELHDVVDIAASDLSFAAWRRDGRVVTWGNRSNGGDSLAVQMQLTNVKEVVGASSAFAAICQNGSVVTWGVPSAGGDSRNVQRELRGVTSITPSGSAFAALRSDRQVVTWGDPSFGGYSNGVQKDLQDVRHLAATFGAFAAVCGPSRRVVVWGSKSYGGDAGKVQET
eukprot:s32_g44.t1